MAVKGLSLVLQLARSDASHCGMAASAAAAASATVCVPVMLRAAGAKRFNASAQEAPSFASIPAVSPAADTFKVPACHARPWPLVPCGLEVSKSIVVKYLKF